MITFDVAIEGGDWRVRDQLISAVCDATRHAARLPDNPRNGTGGFDLSILLTHDAHMRELNKQWRGVDKPTNVLSFPAEPRTPGTAPALAMLGDVVFAHETVAREAQQQAKTFDRHFAHLLAHGLLHLFGYDHETEADAEEMEAFEIAAMARLGIADPYQ